MAASSTRMAGVNLMICSSDCKVDTRGWASAPPATAADTLLLLLILPSSAGAPSNVSSSLSLSPLSLSSPDPASGRLAVVIRVVSATSYGVSAAGDENGGVAGAVDGDDGSAPSNMLPRVAAARAGGCGGMGSGEEKKW